MSTISGVSSIIETYELNSKKDKFDAMNVLKANMDALGGIDTFMNDKTSYTTGKIKISETEYNFREWESKPTKSRRDIMREDYVLYSTGDNGKSIWALDKTTDTLNSYVDAGTRDREFRTKYGDLNYLDENDSDFKVDDMGYETIDGEKHYVVRITNSITDDEIFQYINANTLMMKKTKEVDGDDIIETSFDDFKDVGGMLKPHKKIIENLKTESKQEVVIDKYKRNIVIHDSYFAIPEKNIMGDYELLN